jgi:hypothetical protein
LVCPAALPHLPHLLYGVHRKAEAGLLERLDHDIAAIGLSRPPPGTIWKQGKPPAFQINQ